MAVAIALLVLPILGVSAGDSVNSVSTTTTRSSCTVLGKGGVTVHVVDEKGKPIQNALVMINGTFSCIERALNQSGITDSNGDVMFGLVPDANYNITVILSENRPIIVTTIRVAHTDWTTDDVACRPSANQCSIAAPKSETQATSVTSAPIPFLDFPGILVAILLGLFVVARKKRKEGSAGLGFTRWTIDFYVRASMR